MPLYRENPTEPTNKSTWLTHYYEMDFNLNFLLYKPKGNYKFEI